MTEIPKIRAPGPAPPVSRPDRRDARAGERDDTAVHGMQREPSARAEPPEMALSDEDRREVNRTNSLKSTGPRTEAGKSKSKLNGLKHGLRAATLVLPGEDPEALEHRLDAWTEELDPRTDLERYFVRSAVEAAWRLDRVRRAEAAAVARRVTAAGAEADRKDVFEVEHNLKTLGHWPERNLRTLRGSARGCRAMLARWRDLVAALEHAGSWLDSERWWAFALAGMKPHRWHEDAAVLRLVTLDLATQVDGCTPDETRLFVVAHLKHDEPDMNVTPDEFEDRVEAILTGLPEPAEARAELLVWARAWIVELEATWKRSRCPSVGIGSWRSKRRCSTAGSRGRHASGPRWRSTECCERRSRRSGGCNASGAKGRTRGDRPGRGVGRPVGADRTQFRGGNPVHDGGSDRADRSQRGGGRAGNEGGHRGTDRTQP